MVPAGGGIVNDATALRGAVEGCENPARQAVYAHKWVVAGAEMVKGGFNWRTILNCKMLGHSYLC
jgi:hypothetical protein